MPVTISLAFTLLFIIAFAFLHFHQCSMKIVQQGIHIGQVLYTTHYRSMVSPYSKSGSVGKENPEGILVVFVTGSNIISDQWKDILD